MAALGTHENHKPHEFFLCLDRDQFPCLSQPVYRCAIDGGDESAEGIVVIMASKFLRRGGIS